MVRTKSELHFSARFEKRKNIEDFLKYLAWKLLQDGGKLIQSQTDGLLVRSNQKM